MPPCEGGGAGSSPAGSTYCREYALLGVCTALCPSWSGTGLQIWLRRFESGRGFQWLVAQRRVRRPPKSTIAGSSPAQPTAPSQQWRAVCRVPADQRSGRASLAQWIARRSSKPAGLGSSPRRRTMVRWSKRLTHLVLTQETAGSSPARTTQYTRSARTRSFGPGPLGTLINGPHRLLVRISDFQSEEDGSEPSGATAG